MIDRKLAEGKSVTNFDFELDQLRKARKRSKDRKLTFAADVSFEYRNRDIQIFNDHESSTGLRIERLTN